jgi:hypothetical protein
MSQKAERDSDLRELILVTEKAANYNQEDLEPM